MTRREALTLLRGHSSVTYEQLDDVFLAFNFVTDSPTFETQVYYHPKYPCGMFTARDDGLHNLTEAQKGMVASMLQCVDFNEVYSKS